MSTSVSRSVGVLALLLLFAAAALAQSDTAQISGFVKDPTGAVIPRANVAFHQGRRARLSADGRVS